MKGKLRRIMMVLSILTIIIAFVWYFLQPLVIRVKLDLNCRRMADAFAHQDALGVIKQLSDDYDPELMYEHYGKITGRVKLSDGYQMELVDISEEEQNGVQLFKATYNLNTEFGTAEMSAMTTFAAGGKLFNVAVDGLEIGMPGEIADSDNGNFWVFPDVLLIGPCIYALFCIFCLTFGNKEYLKRIGYRLKYEGIRWRGLKQRHVYTLADVDDKRAEGHAADMGERPTKQQISFSGGKVRVKYIPMYGVNDEGLEFSVLDIVACGSVMISLFALLAVAAATLFSILRGV